MKITCGNTAVNAQLTISTFDISSLDYIECKSCNCGHRKRVDGGNYGIMRLLTLGEKK